MRKSSSKKFDEYQFRSNETLLKIISDPHHPMRDAPRDGTKVQLRLHNGNLQMLQWSKAQYGWYWDHNAFKWLARTDTGYRMVEEVLLLRCDMNPYGPKGWVLHDETDPQAFRLAEARWPFSRKPYPTT